MNLWLRTQNLYKQKPLGLYPIFQEGQREEQSVCKYFCCRVKYFIETDQMSSTKIIKKQTLRKHLLKSWDHTFCKAILTQPSSFLPVTVLQIQQKQAPMAAESQI